MSNYIDDFESYSVASGLPTGWTSRWDATTWSIVDASGDKALRQTQSSSVRGFASLDEIDSDANRDNIEILAELASSSVSATNTHSGIVLRGSGNGTSETGYVCNLFGDDFRIHKYVNATLTQLVIETASRTINTKYFVRFRVNGTALKARIWAGAVIDEPTSWTLETTDSSISAAGWAGAFGFATGDASTWYQMAVATNGDTATFDVSGSQTLTPSLVTNSQTFSAPSITTGAISLTPSLVNNNQTFHSATVGQGGVTLQPSLVTNTQTFFGSTISVGSVTLSPSLLTNGQTFYAPTVSQGDVLRPSLHTNIQTFYAPTITTGAITLAPSLVTNTQTFFAPTVANVGGSQSIIPDLFTNEQTFYSATVSTLTLAQADLDAIAAAVWADATAVAAHAKLDAIIARLTC